MNNDRRKLRCVVLSLFFILLFFFIPVSKNPGKKYKNNTAGCYNIKGCTTIYGARHTQTPHLGGPFGMETAYGSEHSTLPLLQPNVVVLKSDFQVNENQGSCNQRKAAAACCSRGSVVVWEDERDGSRAIYGRRFNGAGDASGPDFKISENDNFLDRALPDVAMAPDGRFVVVWQDYYDVLAQLYDSSGTAIGDNFQVNDINQTIDLKKIAVAMDSAGNFIVVWGDRRYGNADVYSQVFDAAGNPIDVNLLVNDDAGKSEFWHTGRPWRGIIPFSGTVRPTMGKSAHPEYIWSD